MSNMIHRKNSEVRQHLMFNKSSAQILRPKILYAGELKRTVNWNEQNSAKYSTCVRATERYTFKIKITI